MKTVYALAALFLFAVAVEGCKPKAIIQPPSTPPPPVVTNTPVPLPPNTDTVVDFDKDSFFVNGPAQTGGTNAPSTTGTGNPVKLADNYRLVVLFISKGSGINEKARTEFEAWLNGQSKPVKWENTRWGREGEQSYCLKLDEFSTSKEQDKFVQDARIALSGKDLVLIEENVPCKGKR
ncbi:MAG: hypothetical protein ACK5Z2_01410 [Bacteroidota bacterium]